MKATATMEVEGKPTDLCMVDVLHDYNQLRKGAITKTIPFWDLVVLTTSDAAQKEVYDLYIQNKLSRRELPQCAKYHVYHDPPGTKIGSGGSTMYTLNEIAQREPGWRDYKILLMHAGGSSQRLPSASVLGKAFTAVPLGNRLYTMFDVKLALTLPLVSKFSPGVFICCPDTLETFTYGNNPNLTLDSNNGFIALAHPSPLQIGTGHGVYVLDPRDPTLDTEILPCAKVLQKPSEQCMRSNGAILDRQEIPQNILETNPNAEWVFTDSNFYFDHSITEKLVKFYEENGPLSVELCAYGDFLQPLGHTADDRYTNNCKNVISISNDLVSMRRKVFQLLKSSPLDVVALKQSKFYHIGTLEEYLDNYCENESLEHELGLKRFCFSVCHDKPVGMIPEDVQGVVIHSLISSDCKFAARSVVEYCDFENGNVEVGENCVVSNCVYNKSALISFPPDTFVQTVHVKVGESEKVKYVTLVYSLKDNMKGKVGNHSQIGELSYFDRSLLSACEVCKIDRSRLFAEDSPAALWHARLFPYADTPEESLLQALKTINCLTTPTKRALSIDHTISMDTTAAIGIQNGQAFSTPYMNGVETASEKRTPCPESCPKCGGRKFMKAPSKTTRYSFADVIKFKDAVGMIESRNTLATKIEAGGAVSPQ